MKIIHIKTNKDKLYSGRVLLAGLISLIGAALVGASAFADNLDYNVVVKPSLKLTLSSTNPSLNLNPANHTFDTTSLTATVATNYTNGYKLYLDTTSGSGGTSNTELVNTTNSTYTIPTLASSSTSSSFPANYWGYKLDSASTEYLSYVPNTLISQSTTNTNGTSSSIDFAAKIDYEKPAGLYSIAFDLKTIPIVTQTYMQDMTAEQCTTTPTIVIDKRDEQAYMIQRLDDDKCWMLDNLNLDLTNATIVAGLSPENTNANSASLKSLREGNRTDCGEADCSKYATSGLSLQNWTSGASYTVPMANKSGICSTSSVYLCTYDGNYTNNDVLSTLTPNQSTFGLGSGKIGVHYNYCAASAGSYCYDRAANNETPATDTNVDYDICPANWRLPTGAQNGEFRTLCNSIKGSTCEYQTDMDAADIDSVQYKFSGVLSGSYNSNMGYHQGNFGAYWASTIYTNNVAWRLLLFSSKINPYERHERIQGYSVRCLLNEV